MLANILIVTFICGFFGVVALGHVPLIAAVWPDLFKFRREQHLNTVAGVNRRLHHSK